MAPKVLVRPKNLGTIDSLTAYGVKKKTKMEIYFLLGLVSFILGDSRLVQDSFGFDGILSCVFPYGINGRVFKPFKILRAKLGLHIELIYIKPFFCRPWSLRKMYHGYLNLLL